MQQRGCCLPAAGRLRARRRRSRWWRRTGLTNLGRLGRGCRKAPVPEPLAAAVPGLPALVPEELDDGLIVASAGVVPLLVELAAGSETGTRGVKRGREELLSNRVPVSFPAIV